VSPLAQSRPRRAAGHACLLAAVVSLIAACSSGSDPQSSPPPTTLPTSASPSTDPSPTVQAEVIAAYIATYADVTAAVRQRDAMSKVLGRHAIPPAEFQLQQGAAEYLKLGVIPVGVPSLHAKVTSIDVGASPPNAIVTACPQASRLVDARTGHAVATRATALNPVTVDLQLTRGRWLVTFFKVDRKATCAG
jgi:hypothetical protein